MPNAQSPAPTSVRHLVVAVTALMAVLLYLDRFCISFAEIYIKEDLGLSDWQIGWMLSAFFWTYALGQVPSGWLTDRFGSRLMLTVYVLLWSLFTALTGVASGFIALLMLRLGFGFAQAGAYPTGASIISKWVPFPSRGTASSVVAVGGRIGGWLAMIATGYLIVWLTPLSTPARLKASDLLNAPRLCYLLQAGAAAPESGPASQRILATISAPGRALVARLADRYRRALPPLPGGVAPAAETEFPTPSADLQQLAQELNRVIDERGIFTAADLQEVSLEREAVRLLGRQPLDERRSRRLNRLILDSMFRDSLRKLYVAGWRPMMYVYGSLGLLVGGLIWWISRDRPIDHPGCNAAEVTLIEADPRMTGTGGRADVGGTPAVLVRLVLSRSMWMVCLAQWCTNVGWVFVLTWAPRYLQNVHDVPVEQRALMASIPPLVGWAGMLFGGRLTDALVRVVGLRWGRALPMSLSRFLAMGAYLVCLWQPSAWLAVAMFSLVAFATDLGTGSVWAFKQDVGGRYVGSVLGWGNMWGNLGAAVTPPLLIWIVGASQNWDAAFVTCAVAFLIAGLAALGVDATIPIAPRDAKQADEAGD